MKPLFFIIYECEKRKDNTEVMENNHSLLEAKISENSSKSVGYFRKNL